jgi:2-polyprenyl-3-methyl-5-hydroxy-6-metoxy-1,4-benzoquinol methylase
MNVVRNAYDQWHEAHAADNAADSPWHQMVKARLRQSTDVAGKRVLEIGCGLGGFACWLAQDSRSTEIVAADFSPKAVEQGRQKAEVQGLATIKWEVRNIQNLAGPADDFDVVFSFETIEHVPDPPAAVKELARVLKPGGRLFLTTPNYFSTLGLHRVYYWMMGRIYDEGGQPICHVTTMFKTVNWVREAGLHIVDATSCGFYLPIPGRQPKDMAWLNRSRFLSRWLGAHSLIVADKS